MALLLKALVVGVNYQLDSIETHLGDVSLWGIILIAFIDVDRPILSVGGTIPSAADLELYKMENVSGALVHIHLS